jgi:SAM-dependent methyltransferase
MVNAVICNACGHPIAPQPLYQVANCQMVSCPECGLVFVAPGTVSTETLAGIYSQAYFEGGLPDGYTDYSASEPILRRQARRVLRVLQRYQPRGSLLELGCAYGFFLLEAQTRYRTEGIELSSFAAQEAQRRGLQVTCGDFLKLPPPAEPPNAVCLFDCIEHLAEPYAYLRKIHDVLKPGGVVVLTTGDIGSLYARLAGRRWRLMTPPQHLFFFSRGTLGRLLARAGFEPLEVSYPWKLVPLRLMLYQLSGGLKKILGPLGRLPIGLYVNLFDAMLVIARKPGSGHLPNPPP